MSLRIRLFWFKTCPFSTSAVEFLKSTCRIHRIDVSLWPNRRVDFVESTRRICSLKIKMLRNGAERLRGKTNFVKIFVGLREMSWLRCTFCASFFSLDDDVLGFWLLYVEWTVDLRRAKCYQSSHQEAQNGKMRCGLRERKPFGRSFEPSKHPK